MHPEKKQRQIIGISLLLLSIPMQTLVAIETNMIGEKMIPWYIVSASIFITGRIADKISTVRATRELSKAHDAGICLDIRETNPYLPDVPTEREIFGPKKTAIDLLALTAGIINPLAGVIFGLGSFYAAVSNERTRVGIIEDLNES